MGIQYKPTKQKKEKPAKAPKAPKADKPMKMGGAVKVKSSKPAKAPKQPKAPKPEKAIAFKPGKVEKAEQFKGVDKLKKPLSRKVLWITIAACAVIAVALVAVAVLLSNDYEEPVGSLQMLTIESMPDKTEYVVGEKANWYGLKVKASLKGGVTAILEEKDCEITGFDSSKPAEYQTITVTYKGLSVTFNISIVEKQEESGPPFTGVSMKTLPKTKYKVNEWLNVSNGVLLLQYDDGSTREVPLMHEYVYGFTSSKVGTYEVTVKYEERGYLYETSYQITVE